MRFLLISLLFLRSLNGFTQSNFELNYKIISKLQGGIPLERDAKLVYFDKKTLFSYDIGNGIVCVDRNGKIGDENMTYTTVNEVNPGFTMSCYMKDKQGNRIYTDHSKNTMDVRELVILFPHIYSEENIPIIKWKISNESQKIGNFKCKKAKGVFRGREYLVWFTQDLPAKIGPWKLSGLPGAILEVDDNLGEFSIKFVSFKSIKTESLDDVSKWEGDKISFKKFKTIHDDIQKKLFNKTSSSSDRKSKSSLIKLNKLEKSF